jgi:ABC-type transport system involved in cytochrome c biogenesis permease subunit
MLPKILKPLASLWITVILLSLAMILIYAGTWAQVDTGIWAVQKKYFHSFFVWVDFQTLFPRPQPGQSKIPFGFPMIGGYTLGILLLVNLLAAHISRFKFSPYDLLLLPLLGGTGYLVYLWHHNPLLSWMVGSIVLGVAFVLALAALHGKRTGIILIHLGLIVLLAGEGITSGMARESQMTIDEGYSNHFSQDIREPEIAILEPNPDPNGKDKHTVVAAELLEPGSTISEYAPGRSGRLRLRRSRATPRTAVTLPFKIKVESYFKNSGAVLDSVEPKHPSITDPDGTKWTVVQKREIGGANSEGNDIPSVIITLLTHDGRPLGRHTLTVFNDAPVPITVDGKTYDVYLRFRRVYHDYTIKLHDFVHERYTGTTVSKDFASHITLEDPAYNTSIERRVWMNHPLRYRGDTIFQHQFKPGDRTTILQIVRNPGAPLPYVSIIIATVGLILHFGIALASFLLRHQVTTREILAGLLALTGLALLSIPTHFFLGLFWTWMLVGGAIMLALVSMLAVHVARRPPALRPAQSNGPNTNVPGRKAKPATIKRELPPESRWSKATFLFPAAVAAFFAIYCLSHAMPRAYKSSAGFDLDAFARLPISFDGRTQPIDSLARNTVKVLSGRDTAIRLDPDDDGDGKPEETRVPAVQWFLDVINDRGRGMPAERYKVFRIDHLDIKDMIGQPRREKFFTIEQIVEKDRMGIQQALDQAMRVDPKDRNLNQRKLAELGTKIKLYMSIESIGSLHAAAPLKPGQKDWIPLSQAARTFEETGDAHPSLAAFAGIQRAYQQGNAGEFNRQVAAYAKLLETKLSKPTARAAFETWFNRFDPVIVSIAVYVTVFVFALLSWVGWSEPFRRASFWLLALALIVHTVAIAARVYISGRPPVTNLANSAVFIGFGAAIFGLALEVVFPRGIGAACAGLIGFVTLFIYHELARDGDTFKVLVAVLDTNIWLATHVIIVTLGYAATFLAGLLGIVYVIRGVFTTALVPEERKTLARMIYGITCFAILFSFVGTILGGIWADQSWGRFWGWDPKENGAVMIVLANALVLHARWGGLVRERGIANLAIVGNIITAWSWFGTNMLGVGLHSYGFMDSALMWLLAFVFSQIVLIGIGLIPTPYWKSFHNELMPAQQVLPPKKRNDE